MYKAETQKQIFTFSSMIGWLAFGRKTERERRRECKTERDKGRKRIERGERQ